MSVWTRTRAALGFPVMGNKIGKVQRLVKHHEAGPNMAATATVEQEVNRLLSIHAFHQTVRKWQGFAYSWSTFPSGRVYEGRGGGRSGAHTAGLNSTALGSVAIGDGRTRDLTEPEIASERNVIAHMISEGHLAADYVVSGHRDHGSTVCPGDRIYGQLHRLRGVKVGPAGDWSGFGFFRFPAPLTVDTTKDPTVLWDIRARSWDAFQEVKRFPKGDRIVVVGEAHHPLGGRYVMTAFSFGDADRTGVPAHPYGINVADVTLMREPPPSPPSPAPPPDPLAEEIQELRRRVLAVETELAGHEHEVTGRAV